MRSIGFGLERVGLPAVRAPWPALAIIAVLTLVAAAGVPRITTEHTLSELFRSSTSEFADYKTLSDRFPTSEFDVLVVVEAPTLMRPDLLETVRTLHLDLLFAKAVNGVLSIFSMRDPPDESGVPPSMLPAELPEEGPAFDALAERVMAHPLVGGKLLSRPDGKSQLTLLVVTLKRDVIYQQGLVPSIREIEEIAKEILEPEGLKVQLAGAPVMQLEVREAILRDRLIYNTSGFLVGLLVCLAFFRRLKLVLITSACPAVAVVWALGLIGWLDLRLNTFMNVIPPLVLVIAYTDAMHMVFSIRRRLKQGEDRFTAARHAILNVGPACVLTSLTTAIAFLSLTFTDSGLIRTFGVAASFATLMAFVAVIVVVPIMVVLLMRDEDEFVRTEGKRHQAIARIEQLCQGIGDWVQERPGTIAAFGIAAITVFASLHFQLEPRFRQSDQVPDTKQSVAASERIDRKLTGAHPVHIMMRWKEGSTVTSPQVIEAVGAAHALLEKQSGIGNVWSVETLRRWLESIGETGGTVLRDYIDKLPEHLVKRFVNEDARSAVVTGRMPNLESKDAVEVFRDLEARIESLETRYPDFQFTVTGLSAVAALQSSNMISQLNRGLMAAVLIVILLIGVAFRSPRVAALSVFPNMFPIFAAGSVIYLSGGGLEYASVIALTVAFGIAVDDTVHFMSRLNVESGRTATLDDAVYQTISRIGPVLVLTTVVLVAGLAITLFSDLPAMRLFGKLFVATLVAALLGDVLILPALVLSLRKLRMVRKEA